VTPLFFEEKRGVRGLPDGCYGFIQIDYLTLWDFDDGLEIGTACKVLSAGLGLKLEGLKDHRFEEEHSAVLVGALRKNGRYSHEPNDYYLFDVYTAAHEGSFFDHSLYLTELLAAVPVNPDSFFIKTDDGGLHVTLGLSRRKHGTYLFNPDYLPLVPYPYIRAVFRLIDALYYDLGVIQDPRKYLAALYIAYVAFFLCVVEHFEFQGFGFAEKRVNVGELMQPSKGNRWIRVPDIAGKLVPYWLMEPGLACQGSPIPPPPAPEPSSVSLAASSANQSINAGQSTSYTMRSSRP
jgi:hypothetical protein